jgi:hypothetical protein
MPSIHLRERVEDYYKPGKDWLSVRYYKEIEG